MANTLVKNSDIGLEKAKFFLFRAVTYFSFLLIPIWIPKVLDLVLWQKTLLGVLYALFMGSQWFFLGKEIDHRLKIYAKVNSSLDRVIYRILMGIFFLVLYFNIISFLPSKWIYNLFWVTWGILGIFYSWPTRGKIIRESVFSQLGEFRFLDSFERTVLFLIIVFFILSIPELPIFHTIDSLRLFYDPHEFIHTQFWTFLEVTYYPFRKYKSLLQVAWWINFYVVALGLDLLLIYAIARYFVSRRLSLLSVLIFISSWSLTKLLSSYSGILFPTMAYLTIFWAYLWVIRSATYRAGLFWGLAGYFVALIHPLLSALQVIFSVILLRRYINKTSWYKRQFVRYMSLGIVMMLVAVLTADVRVRSIGLLPAITALKLTIGELLLRKGIYIVSFIGLFIAIGKYRFENYFTLLKSFSFGPRRNEQLLSFILLTIILLYFLSSDLYSVVFMAILSLLSMIPVELLFQRIYRLRSSRNMIYAVYILLCLLDSHLEGHVKIFISIFK